MAQDPSIHHLIDRLARLQAAHGWGGDLNPTQRAMLGYLGQANRFSRSPSHVADYLGATRGTTTQSLKSLQQKGYVAEQRSTVDKRVIRYELTQAGRDIAAAASPLGDVIADMAAADRDSLHQLLRSTLLGVLARHSGREFGLCKTCQHHQTRDGAPYCGLLDVSLTRDEADQICHEQVSPPG